MCQVRALLEMRVLFEGGSYMRKYGSWTVLKPCVSEIRVKQGVGYIVIIISSVVKFQRWWVLNRKIFSQESTYSKEKNRKNNPSICRNRTFNQQNF